MRCPYCGSDNYTARGSHKKEIRRGRVRRQRVCLDCGGKFKTLEFYVPDDIVRHKKGTYKREEKKNELE